MLLQEIPALPFALDVQSATEWLDQLPLGNIRECCQRFLPVQQALNVYPMPLQLRFELLERCHPMVQGLERGLMPHFIDAVFPMEEKARKIASLAARFHLEAALGYRQLVEAAAFQEAFDAPCRLFIYRRCLEHLLQSMLRSAQVYEAPSSSVLSSFRRLYRHAAAAEVLDATAELEGRPPVVLRDLFLRFFLFGLAVPRGLPQDETQRLFDGLALLAKQGSPVADEAGLRSAFCFDPEELDILVPVAPGVPVPAGLPCVSAERALSVLRETLRASVAPESHPLRRVLPRLGDRLPCLEAAGGRRVSLATGFKAVVPMLKDIEFRRSKPGRRAETWAGNELELAPLDSTKLHTAPRFTGRTLAEAVVASETAEKNRMVEVVPSELPGFYLLDSGRWMLRAGSLIGLNSDDEWVQLGVLRSGQIRDGRFWHSFELLGANPRLIRARNERLKDGVRNAVWLEASEPDGQVGLLTEPCKWRGGDGVMLDFPGGKRRVCIVKLVEASPSFYRYTLAESGAEEAMA